MEGTPFTTKNLPKFHGMGGAMGKNPFVLFFRNAYRGDSLLPFTSIFANTGKFAPLDSANA